MMRIVALALAFVCLAVSARAAAPDEHSACKSATWAWGDVAFRAPKTMLVRLDREGGQLLALDRGEWSGGGLYWKPKDGNASLVWPENAHGIVATPRGALVIYGLAHMFMDEGSVGAATRLSDGSWTAQKIADLPASSSAIGQIAPDLYAVWSAGRAFVLSPDRLEGEATCVAK